MTEFRIGRGHDGPARIGEYIIGTHAYTTPTLIGDPSRSYNILSYGTLGRTSIASQPLQVFSIPFTINIQDISIQPSQKDASFLLPSMISFSSLDDISGNLLLKHQIDAVDVLKDTIDPSQLIVRIPEASDISSIMQEISILHKKGIRAAAVSFDGLLGSSDLNAIALRSQLPLSWLTIALGKIVPSTIPLLFYHGFDIFDVGYAHEAAATRHRLWHNGIEEVTLDTQYRYCPCVSCSRLESANEIALEDILYDHNMMVYASIISESIEAQKNGKLRWLVESMTHTSPSHASFIRNIDKMVYDFMEEFTPSTGAKIVPLIGPESYNAPLVRRYREFLANRYEPPQNKRIVLLLPCSAKKPYSDSKSHKRLLRTIESALGNSAQTIAQVILTSPLGIVPRELERIFPAANYDIPVTGDWDVEETRLGADALATHMSKFDPNVTVVAHVSGGYLGIVKSAEDKISQSIIYTTADTPATSRESLAALHETLTDLKELLELKSTPIRLLEEIVQATADFQFGHGAGKLLVPDGAKLSGKPYRQIICRVEGEQVCSFIAAAGSLSLTLNGAKRLAPLNSYWVQLEAPVVKGGSIFAVGVSKADSNIRPGDEVIILNQSGKVTAVGRSEMSGREMCELDRGRAVSVRHKEEGE